jgi:hypothetical protein
MVTCLKNIQSKIASLIIENKEQNKEKIEELRFRRDLILSSIKKFK